MRFEEIHDDLTRTVWTFCKIENIVYLNFVSFQERKTKRHGWKVDKNSSYSRINDRDHGIKEEPDIPIDISCDALEHFKNKITLKKWKCR